MVAFDARQTMNLDTDGRRMTHLQTGHEPCLALGGLTRMERGRMGTWYIRRTSKG